MMSLFKNAIHKVILGEEFYFLPQKAIFRSSDRALLLSDLHLGKALTFQKNGIPLSQTPEHKDLQDLEKLIKETKARNVYFLGDLFHSKINTTVKEVLKFIAAFSEVNFVLVMGNHDLYSYGKYNLPSNMREVHVWEDTNFIYNHEPIKTDKFLFCGHIHPGFVLGTKREKIAFPCFYFVNNSCILPSFGTLTGLHKMDKSEDAEVLLIAENKIFLV